MTKKMEATKPTKKIKKLSRPTMVALSEALYGGELDGDDPSVVRNLSLACSGVSTKRLLAILETLPFEFVNAVMENANSLSAQRAAIRYFASLSLDRDPGDFGPKER